MAGGASIWSSSRHGSEKDQALDDGDGPGTRTVHQQDYDRLVFSTPVRRLANKTQVWPMDANDGVRSRLTHSHEVANLARSIGARITEVVRKHDENPEAEHAIQPILLAAGLSHDLGNPPFGHQGEVAIGNWFARRSGWIFTHERIEAAIVEFLPQWSLAPLVEALQALRGIRLPTAATIVAEIGDLGRFDSARQFMGYLGLVPGERSTGETVRRLGITKAGNGRVRRALVESAWTYRHPARVGKDKLYQHRRVSPAVRDIAWKAQTRLCSRYRALSARGKKLTVAVTAIARELAGFIWAIGRKVKPA